MTRVRKPDFVILGAMKAGTTQLYRWLEEHPDVWLPPVKEPKFFSRDSAWKKGVAHYFARFAPAPAGARTGEASPEYLDPAWSFLVSARLQQTVPEARLVAILRDPVARMRSHYLHEVLRGRERRQFSQAIGTTDSPYVRRSCYGAALAGLYPWLEDGRLLVLAFQELFGEATRPRAWAILLRHLGLPDRPCPTGQPVNRTADKLAFSPLMRRLYGPLALKIRAFAPPGSLRVLQPLLLRDPRQLEWLTESSNAPIPAVIETALTVDQALLTRLLPDVQPPARVVSA